MNPDFEFDFASFKKPGWEDQPWYLDLGYRARGLLDDFVKTHPGIFDSVHSWEHVKQVVADIDWHFSVQLKHAHSADNIESVKKQGWKDQPWYLDLGHRARGLLDDFAKTHPGVFDSVHSWDHAKQVVASIDWHLSVQLKHAHSADNADIADARLSALRGDSRPMIPMPGIPPRPVDKEWAKGPEFYRTWWRK